MWFFLPNNIKFYHLYLYFDPPTRPTWTLLLDLYLDLVSTRGLDTDAESIYSCCKTFPRCESFQILDLQVMISCIQSFKWIKIALTIKPVVPKNKDNTVYRLTVFHDFTLDESYGCFLVTRLHIYVLRSNVQSIHCFIFAVKSFKTLCHTCLVNHHIIAEDINRFVLFMFCMLTYTLL